MKVRISMPGVYMVMDMEEGQARAAFHKLAESMWLIGSRGQKPQESVVVEPGPVQKKSIQVRTDRGLGQWRKLLEPRKRKAGNRRLKSSLQGMAGIYT